MVIHNSLRLYLDSDTFTIEPVYNDPSVVTENIIIRRNTGEIRLNAPAGRVAADEEVMTIYGIVGFIRLIAGEYMIVITDRTKIGRIGDHDIFKLKEYKVISFARNNLGLSEAQINEEATYISLLHSHLQSGPFHFSYGYEITHTQQRLSEIKGDKRPIWEKADERFFWNFRLQSKFIDHTKNHRDQDDYAFRRHFEAQKRKYGPQLVINLINKKGYEEPMGSTFSKQIDILNDPQIKYFHFDFHQECSKMRWHRVSLLLDHFHSDLVSQGYFKAETTKDGQTRVSHRQTSIVRTNCMDCLDRTNVVQSVISRWVLTRQLQELGILSPNESIESHEQFEALFRNVWADNADIVSCAYSGTGALKTDFTRTGQRTKVGALRDLQNSIVRYVKNNFLDGARQDAYDLVLNYDVHEAGVYPFVDTRPMHLKAAPMVLIVVFAMFTSALILPEVLMTLTIRFIVANGMHYVNWPKLVPLGYDLPVNQFANVSQDSKHAVTEIEMGWKNE
ncbi:hypothetical protein BG003_004114 [Podila horticola]|nr:hypothetical protein BG003_004114 [Podila horticola]